MTAHYYLQPWTSSRLHSLAGSTAAKCSQTPQYSHLNVFDYFCLALYLTRLTFASFIWENHQEICSFPPPSQSTHLKNYTCAIVISLTALNLSLGKPARHWVIWAMFVAHRAHRTAFPTLYNPWETRPQAPYIIYNLTPLTFLNITNLDWAIILELTTMIRWPI